MSTTIFNESFVDVSEYEKVFDLESVTDEETIEVTIN